MSRLGDPDALKGYMKIGDWNQVHLIARGNTLIQILNGAVMSMVVDEDLKNRQLDGPDRRFRCIVGASDEGRVHATSGSRPSEIVTAQFLAFDLGAESGRAMLGTLNDGVLGVREIHRFPNEPVRQNGSLQWDILHLWQEMRRALELNGRHPPRQRRRRQLGRRLRAASASAATCSRTRTTIATGAPTARWRRSSSA